MALQRTTMYFSEHDRKVLEKLCARYGFATNSQAIRFALRTAAALPTQHSVPVPEPLPPAPPSVSCSHHQEEIVILTEKLAASQEEMRLMQEELTQTQQELHYASQELQGFNQLLIEKESECPVRAVAVAVGLPAVRELLEHEKQVALALRAQAAQARRQAAPLCNRALALQEWAQTNVLRLEQTAGLLGQRSLAGQNGQQKG
jgi:hypothetical protein